MAEPPIAASFDLSGAFFKRQEKLRADLGLGDISGHPGTKGDDTELNWRPRSSERRGRIRSPDAARASVVPLWPRRCGHPDVDQRELSRSGGRYSGFGAAMRWVGRASRSTQVCSGLGVGERYDANCRSRSRAAARSPLHVARRPRSRCLPWMWRGSFSPDSVTDLVTW